jgi:hypothetical protein
MLPETDKRLDFDNTTLQLGTFEGIPDKKEQQKSLEKDSYVLPWDHIKIQMTKF